MDDFYAIFGVQPDATRAQIKARYRFLAQAYHPDKFASEAHKQYAEEAFKKINEAFQTLSNPKLRANYDRQRRTRMSAQPPTEVEPKSYRPPSPPQPKSQPKTKPQPEPPRASPPPKAVDEDADEEPPPQATARLSVKGGWVLFLLFFSGVCYLLINYTPLPKLVVQTPSPSQQKIEMATPQIPSTAPDGTKGDPAVLTEKMKAWATQGKADAQEYLGRCYATGSGGVQLDLETSAKWYNKSAEQGRVNSQYAIGEGYYSGEKGVSRDFVQAYKWLSLAVNHGDLDPEKNQTAKSILSSLNLTMTPEEIAEAQRLVIEYNKIK